jgi:hypothetical protein
MQLLSIDLFDRFTIKRVSDDISSEKCTFSLNNLQSAGVDTKVSKALAHRASTGHVQLARM